MKTILKYCLCSIALLFFINGNSQNFSTQGSAQLSTTTPLTYTITPNQPTNSGMITNYFPLNLNSTFEINFEMNFGSTDGNGADGMAVTLSNLCNPTLVPGGGLGIPELNNIMIIEFDTYDNDGTANSDLAADHIGIYNSGIPRSSLANLIIEGSSIPVCILGNCGNVEDNTFIPIKLKWIYISATQQKLEVYVNNSLRATSTTANHLANIFLGNTNAFWSISGATGALTNLQSVRFPDFTNTIVSCIGSTISLTAPALGSNYVWSNNSSNTNVANYNTTTNQTIICSYTDFCGQSKTVNFNLQANTTPAVPIITSPIVYCQNATASPLSANGSNLLWYTSATGGTGSAVIPTPNTATAGTTLYYVSQTVSGCESARAAISVVVNPLPTIVLSSAASTANQTSCINTPIIPIQYTLGGNATGVSITGLPDGVTYLINGNIVTISGTPTATTAATFNYTLTATGNTCGAPNTSGTITIATEILPLFNSISPVCQGDTINLPTTSTNGILGVWNLITTTTNDVTYQFTSNTGQCALNTTMTIGVNPTPTLLLSSAITSSNQVLCMNSPISPIQYTFGGNATGVTISGLPAGVTYAINGSIVTISGTPTTTLTGIFSYTITATGNACGAPNLSGTIEVTNGILPLFNQVVPVCQGASINLPTSSNNSPPIVGVWNLISSTANDVTYQFIPNVGQCALNTTMTIVVHPLPIVTPSVTTQNFCSGGTTNINLTSNVPGTTFSWTATATTITGHSGSVTGSGATSINQTLVLNPNILTPGQVTYVIVAEANGCVGASVTVTVTVNPIPNVIATPTTQTICSGQTTSISFSGAINNTVFTWNVLSSVGVSGALNGTGNAINQILTTTGLSQGTVLYEITPTINGCTGAPQTVSVTVNPVPVAFGSATHQDLCSGESTFINVLTFNPSTTFNWVVEPFGVSGASAGSATGSSILIEQALSTTGNTQGYVDYIITPVLTACAGTPITVRVYVNPLPVVSLTDGTICVDAAGVPFQTYLLDSGLDNANYDFVWTFEGNTIPNATQATYSAAEVGTYTVVATNSTTNCVSNIASAVVTATNPATSLTVAQSDYFSDNATLIVTVAGGNGTLLYQLDAGILQESNVFTGVSGGSHTITVVDTQGCTYLTQEVLIIDYPRYFTPNGDGHNDTWNILGLNQPDAKLFIFDRYGKLIKQIAPSSSSSGWDGTYNNAPMPSTDYWFTLDYTENGAAKQFKAHFSLKR
jgi:gliding motility-associated-like protein